MIAISLFSSSGIGDLGLRANGIDTAISCEIINDRVKMFGENFPNTKTFCGDIWVQKNEIIQYYKNTFSESPFLIMATPPCQGMSSNGMGKMLSDFRKGLRHEYDERNRLIIPAVHIIKELKPEWVIFENVANMTNTLIIDENDQLVNIIDYIFKILSPEYVGKAEVIDVADYGIAQNRKRLITILTKSPRGKKYFEKSQSFLPKKTHSECGDMFTNKWITLREVIGNLPPLDGKKGHNENKRFHPLHKVPPLDDKKYFWVSNTKEGDTAFNNQCVNPNCQYQENTKHGAKRNGDGINRFNEDTPLYCEKCGEILPRPWVEDKNTGQHRIMKGYVSAYKRMKWDEPASTLTQNFQFACSDNKLHPSQNRVLSMLEASIIQSIENYGYKFSIAEKIVNDGLIRDAIGESVPPKVIDIICKNILTIFVGEDSRV